jgi:hypothetical protein
MSDLNLQEISRKVQSGELDTILVCFVDMQGRLMGLPRAA